MSYIKTMISPVQAFNPAPILPVSRLRGTAAPPSEELAKTLRAAERANEQASQANNYTVTVPQRGGAADSSRAADATTDNYVGGRTRRYVRDDAVETYGNAPSATPTGLFSFAPAVTEPSVTTLASLQPVQAQLDSAAFLSLYASNDSFPALSDRQRLAQPFQIASQALASRFAFGEELALSIAA